MQPRLPPTRWRRLTVMLLFLIPAILIGCGDVPLPESSPQPIQPDAAAGLRSPVASGAPSTPAPATPFTAGPLAAAGLLPPARAAGTETPPPAATGSPCRPVEPDVTPTSIYVSSDDGYCLRYPSTMKLVVGEGQAHTITFRGPGHKIGGQEAQVSVLVEVQPAAGETLDQIIAGVLASYAPEVANGAVRQDAQLGGQPAIVMEGLPGQLANRQAFVIRNDRVYHLVISPFREPSMPDLQAEAEAAWEAITTSLAFLPDSAASAGG